MITILLFLVFEAISWFTLKTYYETKFGENNDLKNVKSFSLFSLKDIFVSPLELSTYYSYRFKSNIKKGNEFDFPVTIYKGLRDEKYDNEDSRPLLRDNDTYDIYLFGGSTIFLKDNHESLGKYINKFLDKANCFNQKKIFRVITAGESGYGTINQINRLVSDVIYLKPEHVIFFDGINDFLHSHNNPDWEINDTIHQRNYRNIYNNANSGDVNFAQFFQELPMRFYTIFLLNKVVKKFTGIILIKNRFEKEIINQFKLREALAEKNLYNKESVLNYIQNHRVLKTLSNEFNFKTLQIFQPTLAYDIELKINGYQNVIYENFFPEPYNVLSNKEKKLISDYYKIQIINFYKDVNLQFKNFENSDQNMFVNFSDIFKSQNNLEDIYYDSFHYNDKYAINIISNQIAQRILIHLKCFEK